MSKKSKNIIADSLIELMKKEPLKDITISQLCNNTTIVRKTFYNNFSTKEDAVEHICSELIKEYYEMIMRQKNFNTRDMSHLFFIFGKKNKEVISLLIENNLYYLFQRQFILILPELNQAVPDNSYLEIDEEYLPYVFSFHTAGVLQMLELWISSGFKETEQKMSELYDKIARGI